MMISFRLAAMLLTTLLAGACASNGSTEPTPQEMNAALKDLTGQNGRACLRVGDIQGYGTLSDSVISVRSTFRKQYLLVTTYRCPAVETSMGALFKGSFAEFCGGGRDYVTTRDGRCPIQGVFEFENRDEAFDTHDQAEETIRKTR